MGINHSYYRTALTALSIFEAPSGDDLSGCAPSLFGVVVGADAVDVHAHARVLRERLLAEQALRLAVELLDLLAGQQGLTLVRFSAQREPFLTKNTPSPPPDTP